ncbi:MAG: GNAT family N-acetyltransferase [Lachnospiraceae bacterium]|nr:GNAT family N-acetyltransferase [Lachnospiraceae bacterium]
MILRLPVKNDFDFYYELKCEPSSIYWSGFASAPDREKLYVHFMRFVKNNFPDRDFYILEDQGVPTGYLQLTHNNATEIEIGYGVSEKYRGRGYGYCILDQAKQIVAKMNGCINLIGYVRDDNYSSKKCFEKNGFFRNGTYVKRYFALDSSDAKMYLYYWNKQM